MNRIPKTTEKVTLPSDGIKPMVDEDNVTVSRNHFKSFIHLPMECISFLFTAIGSPLKMMIGGVGNVDVAGVPHE